LESDRFARTGTKAPSIIIIPTGYDLSAEKEKAARAAAFETISYYE
jgi:hypothetical protein